MGATVKFHYLSAPKGYVAKRIAITTAHQDVHKAKNHENTYEPPSKFIVSKDNVVYGYDILFEGNYKITTSTTKPSEDTQEAKDELMRLVDGIGGNAMINFKHEIKRSSERSNYTVGLNQSNNRYFFKTHHYSAQAVIIGSRCIAGRPKSEFKVNLDWEVRKKLIKGWLMVLTTVIMSYYLVSLVLDYNKIIAIVFGVFLASFAYAVHGMMCAPYERVYKSGKLFSF